MTPSEAQLEQVFIEKLTDLKYTPRPDIRACAALEKKSREKFQTLNCVNLTDAEFQPLLDEIVTADVFAAAKILRDRNSYTHDDDTPPNYTLVKLVTKLK